MTKQNYNSFACWPRISHLY